MQRAKVPEDRLSRDTMAVVLQANGSGGNLFEALQSGYGDRESQASEGPVSCASLD